MLLIISFSLLCGVIHAGDYSSYLEIHNPTPYTMFLVSQSGGSGSWSQQPADKILPFSVDKPIRVDTFAQGSSGTLNYRIVLGVQEDPSKQINMGTFSLDFGCGYVWGSSNTLKFVPQYGSLQIRKADSSVVGYIDHLFVNSSVNTCNQWRTDGTIAEGNPICIRAGLKDPLETTIEKYKTYLIMDKNVNPDWWIYVKQLDLIFPSTQKIVKLAHPIDFDFNCFAYSVDLVGAPYNDPDGGWPAARTFYGKYGYTEIGCDQNPDVVLFCTRSSGPRGCERTKAATNVYVVFTHAVKVFYKNNQPKYFSKLGLGALTSQPTLEYENSRAYGTSAGLCFKKTQESIISSQPLNYVFTQKELVLMEEILSKVSQNLKDEFNDYWIQWETSWHSEELIFSGIYELTAQGKEFDQLIKMGTNKPSEFMPLLIEKMMQPTGFLASFIYEIISEVQIDREETIQRTAYKQSKTWLALQIESSNTLL